MTISHLLEDFSTIERGLTVSLTDLSLEEQKLESFEAGYKAGWDDAVKAQDEDGRRISSDFANNLHDLSFTYEEAMSGMLRALQPLLTEMVHTVLPKLSRETLGTRVIGMLHDIAKQQGRNPVEIITAPANMTALEPLVAGIEGLPPVTLLPEPTLGEGQVHIRMGDSEHEIDLDAVLAEIDTAVSAFFDDRQKEIA